MSVNQTHVNLIAQGLNIRPAQAEKTMELLSEGSTVPFISRYRKEVTGSLDEVQIASIQDLSQKYAEIDSRRATIIKSITEQGKMTDELQSKLETSWSLTELEDLYLPYKPKRKTRATIAIEKGLEPLAHQLFAQEEMDLEGSAGGFLNDQVASTDEALKGARDIIAEWINETAEVREKMRTLFQNNATFKTAVVEEKKEEGAKYKDYFEFSELLKDSPSHRVLAIFRAENEGILHASINPEEEDAIGILQKHFIKASNSTTRQMELAINDSYKRLMRPSLENEFRSDAKERADEAAIEIFAENLRQLLMAAPLGPKPVIAIDPGYRTGCKVVALDASGTLLAHDVIFPNENNRKMAAEALLQDWVYKYDAHAIAIGNGTAGRETESFVKGITFGKKVLVFMISESGASVYSASEVAREEFASYDVTVRGAVSIGRRLMDPLAELVKIDPKSIGVGQYQHDVNQSRLKQSLDRIVVSCVNTVGVNLNTASKHLLAYVSGLGPSLAENIVKYRAENGLFNSRKTLKKVSRLGDKAFEQCAGFLRIPGADNPLDNTAVHPESYELVERMAADKSATVKDLIAQDELRKEVNLKQYVTDERGLPTLQDIISELAKPGRDPRDEISAFEYADGINKIEDLKVGMELPGIVTNITAFGAFVDIGVKQDGLVHISQMANRYISNPSEVVKLNQKVQVTVVEVDAARKRIALSMVGNEPAQKERRQGGGQQPNKGQRPQQQQPRKEQEKKEPLDFNSSLAALKSKFGK